jgi:hypothetical protein
MIQAAQVSTYWAIYTTASLETPNMDFQNCLLLMKEIVSVMWFRVYVKL